VRSGERARERGRRPNLDGRVPESHQTHIAVHILSTELGIWALRAHPACQYTQKKKKKKAAHLATVRWHRETDDPRVGPRFLSTFFPVSVSEEVPF
jgi:hypothetical protein